MKVFEIEEVMDGWTNLRVEVYSDETDTYATAYDSSHEECVCVPDKIRDFEVTTLRFDHPTNSFVVYCDYVEEDD